MNKEILHTEAQDFINANLKNNVTKLVLKGSPFKNISIQQLAEQIESKNKCEHKLPTWFNLKNCYFPNKLNIEQSSSEKTAQYKANLVSGEKLIDISGGFGVDTFYFSKKIKRVIHCEINSNLSEIAQHNFNQLDVKNVDFKATDGLNYLENNAQTYNWIYIDPSRRNQHKTKVFFLEDCEPNILNYSELLLNKAPNILIKLSPLLDLTNTLNSLKNVKEIHIVAIENEVKELLFVLNKNHTGATQIFAVNINKNKTDLFSFVYGTTTIPEFSLPKKYIYEPNVAILKSGGFNEVCSNYNVYKLHNHSHLYTSDELINFPGRRFELLQECNYNAKEILQFIPNNKANITTRNFPQTVAQIRKKLKLKDGGDLYLFFTTSIKNKHTVLICRKAP